MRRNLNNNFITGLSFLLIFSAIELAAKGLAVAPPRYTWSNVSLGRKVTMPMKIIIKNTSRIVTSYTLRAVTPESINSKLDDGFDAIASVKWISFDRKHIVINPGEMVHVQVYAAIPKRDGYAKKHWQFFVEVKEHSGLGKMFNLACYPKISIITDDLKASASEPGKFKGRTP